MNSFKNPLVPLIDDPVNIDRPIQAIQQALADMGWLDKSFGRSFLATKKTQGSLGQAKLVAYPHVWQGLEDNGKARDLLEVLPNDNLKSQSFFKVEDPIQVVEFVPDHNSMMRATVSIIFWFNLQKIDPSIDYVYIELLKGQVQRVLTEMLMPVDSTLTLLRVWEGPQNVWRGYNIQDVGEELLIYPWGGFRFECDIAYREDCPYTAYDIPPAP